MRQQLQSLLANPKLLGRAVNRRYYRLVNGRYNENSIDILEKDWDNLIILNACRFDLFEEQLNLEGELYRVESEQHDRLSAGQFRR